ncbi:MAG: UDP-N-acetylmuramoyl-L-alanine--D-glutamate ligase [Arachnia sp.]
MRPRLGFTDLIGARVGIFGLGVEGKAAREECRRLGIEPVVVDDRVPEALGVTDGGAEALGACDIVIVSPGITPYSGLVAQLTGSGVITCGALGLWLHGQDPGRVVLVTGTKGKSTTTSLLAHLATRSGISAAAVGNIGTPPFGDHAPVVDFHAVEVSASQAFWLPVGTTVSVVTSLSPDHLPWHGGSVEQYYSDKLSVCTLPGAGVTIANGDDPVLREHATQLGDVEWVQAQPADWLDELPLLGQHNGRNALLAMRALQRLGIADDSFDAAGAAASFKPLPGRLTVVAREPGVDYVDDGLATNVLPVIAALDAVGQRPTALLLGGQERGIDYAGLAAALADRAWVSVVTMPDNGPRIAQAVAHGSPTTQLHQAPNLRRAVELGRELVLKTATEANPGMVLLSPGAPSFGHFVDYRDRGAAFAQHAAELAR